jgi:hypothetical protein
VFTPFRVPLRSLSILWHCDPKKETDRCFFIDPFVDFGFFGPAQLPDLVFNLLGIHGSLSCNYFIYIPWRRNSPILFSMRYGYFYVEQGENLLCLGFPV